MTGPCTCTGKEGLRATVRHDDPILKGATSGSITWKDSIQSFHATPARSSDVFIATGPAIRHQTFMDHPPNRAPPPRKMGICTPRPHCPPPFSKALYTPNPPHWGS